MLQYLMTYLQAREEGQGLVEYALVISLIAVVAIGSLGILSGNVNGLLESISF